MLEAQSDKAKNGTFALNMTNSRHIEAEGLGNGDESLMYRTPMQPSIDQNTVDAQLEQSNYAENAVGFQASFTLLNSKFRGWCQPCAESKSCPCPVFLTLPVAA